jgi:hypothetical protein
MRINLLYCLLSAFTIFAEQNSSATQVYFNDFSGGSSSIANWLTGPELGSVGSWNVGVVGGQLGIVTGLPLPTGAYAAVSSANFSSPYSSVLAYNPGVVSWGFNLWNQDGQYNNKFSVGLASSSYDPFNFASGYFFEGGGFVGNRMVLFRIVQPPYGNTSATPIIDVPLGLGTAPQIGSFRITFDPATSLWSLYGVMDTGAVDPGSVSTLLGTVVDNTLTGVSLPYLSLSGDSTGYDVFDNLSVTVIPEPALAEFAASAFAVLLGAHVYRRRSNDAGPSLRRAEKERSPADAALACSFKGNSPKKSSFDSQALTQIREEFRPAFSAVLPTPITLPISATL